MNNSVFSLWICSKTEYLILASSNLPGSSFQLNRNFTIQACSHWNKNFILDFTKYCFIYFDIKKKWNLFNRFRHKEKVKFQKQLVKIFLSQYFKRFSGINLPNELQIQFFSFFWCIFPEAKICPKSLFCRGATVYRICPSFLLWNNVILKSS